MVLFEGPVISLVFFFQNDISNSLSRLAAEVCSKYSDSDNYKSDPWVYNLNWTAPDMKLLKLPRKGTKVVGDINGVNIYSIT